MTKRGVFALVLFAAVSIPLLFAQEVSKKKDISVFNLSYYSHAIPNSALGSIDEQIRSVFINLGRFNVIGMTYRLGENDVNEFIEKIKKFKEEKAVIPEKVQMGKEYFTAADFNKLIGSFIVVIPAVAGYITEKNDKTGELTVTIRTSFTFINVEEIRSFAQFFVETKGTDKNSAKAIQEAVDAIPDNLTFETRKVSEFQLRTGILEVKGGEVIIELGKDMGVTVGDEYLIMVSKVLASGKQISTEKGLITIKEVQQDTSKGAVVYSEGAPEPGEQLQELPRFGTDTTPYVHVGYDLFGGSGMPILVGARQTLSKGFYAFRPLAGIELPVNLITRYSLVANVVVGGELDLNLGRLTIAPIGAAGLGMRIPFSDLESFSFSHAGGSASVAVEYLFDKDMKFVVEGGYLMWLDIAGGSTTYQGVFAGGGLTIKY